MATTSTPTLTATATSRTSGEPMDPMAVLLAGPRRARDASGLLQLVEERAASAHGIDRPAAARAAFAATSSASQRRAPDARPRPRDPAPALLASEDALTGCRR
jgi:hypothetical protein